MTLREWTAADIPAVKTIEETCFSAPWSEASLIAALGRKDNIGLVLEEDGACIAYALSSVLFEDGEVLRIAVGKERRGEGLGGLLFDKLLAAMKERGAERVFLEVRVSNVSAIRLYTARGFERTRERKNYYADGETAWEMKKVF